MPRKILFIIISFLLIGCGTLFDDSSNTEVQSQVGENVTVHSEEVLQQIAAQCCQEVDENLECTCYLRNGIQFSHLDGISGCKGDFLECSLANPGAIMGVSRSILKEHGLI